MWPMIPLPLTAGSCKYSKVSGAWTLNNVISLSGARGITASVSGSTVTIYTTFGTTSVLTKIVDTAGYNASNNGTPSNLVTAATNTVFRRRSFCAPDFVYHPVHAPRGHDWHGIRADRLAAGRQSLVSTPSPSVLSLRI